MPHSKNLLRDLETGSKTGKKGLERKERKEGMNYSLGKEPSSPQGDDSYLPGQPVWTLSLLLYYLLLYYWSRAEEANNILFLI